MLKNKIYNWGVRVRESIEVKDSLTLPGEGWHGAQREGSVETTWQRGGRRSAGFLALLVSEELCQVGRRCGNESRWSRHHWGLTTAEHPKRTARQIPETNECMSTDPVCHTSSSLQLLSVMESVTLSNTWNSQMESKVRNLKTHNSWYLNAETILIWLKKKIKTETFSRTQRGSSLLHFPF